MTHVERNKYNCETAGNFPDFPSSAWTSEPTLSSSRGAGKTRAQRGFALRLLKGQTVEKGTWLCSFTFLTLRTPASPLNPPLVTCSTESHGSRQLLTSLPRALPGPLPTRLRPHPAARRSAVTSHRAPTPACPASQTKPAARAVLLRHYRASSRLWAFKIPRARAELQAHRRNLRALCRLSLPSCSRASPLRGHLGPGPEGARWAESDPAPRPGRLAEKVCH